MSFFRGLSLQEQAAVFAILHGTYYRGNCAGLEVPRPTLHAERGHPRPWAVLALMTVRLA